MRKYYFLFVIIILSVITIKSGVITKAEELITAEDLMEYAGVSKNDISDETVSDFIAFYKIGKTALNDISPEEMKSVLLDIKDISFKNNYSFLLNDPCALTKPQKAISLDDVSLMLLGNSYGVLFQCLLIDLKNDMYYYDPNTVFIDDITKASMIDTLSEDKKRNIRDAWEKADWENWEYNYESEMTIENENWFMVIKTNDDIFRYTMKGSPDDFPESLNSFSSNIIKMFWY